MSALIQHFRLRVVALPNHGRYGPWDTAEIVVFIREEDRQTGLKKLDELLARERWQKLKLEQHDRLIESRIMEAGPVMRDAYLAAQRDGSWFQVHPDNFGAGEKPFRPMAPPRLSESFFVDRWMVNAGGRRYCPPSSESVLPLNADYLWEDFIIELKEIRSDALVVPTRRQKLAALFAGHRPDECCIELNPDVLPEEKRRQFFDLIGSPIDEAVSKAAKQIRETRRTLGDESLRGAVILINGGTPFYTHEMFCELASAAAAKPGRGITELFCITTEFRTNGFDNTLNFRFFPEAHGSKISEVFFHHYDALLSEMMDEWGRTGFQPPRDALPPHQAFGFDSGERTFYWDPGRLPSSMKREF